MTEPNDRLWLRFYGAVPHTLEYPRITLYEALARTAQRVPGDVAWDFLDTTATYRELLDSIDEFCRERLIKWSCLREVEFRAELPKTQVGKIDYRSPVQEHVAREARREAA